MPRTRRPPAPQRKLKGHAGAVYAVAWSKDGTRLASGGADHAAVVWDAAAGRGTLKFHHETSVQALAFNPVSNVLASCSNADFGLWAPDARKVAKFQVESKILAAAWSSDGLRLALGHESGEVALRDADGRGMTLVGRGEAPAWCLAWIPSRGGLEDFAAEDLAVGSWDNRVRFYGRGGKPRERTLDHLPCSLSRSGGNHDDFLVVAGSSCSPSGDRIALGMDSGAIAVYAVNFPLEWSAHGAWMAWREHGTEVVLTKAERCYRIRCFTKVQKIALSTTHLAVKLSDRIALHELELTGDATKCVSSFSFGKPCDNFHLTKNHLVVSKDEDIFLVSFHGEVLSERTLRSRVNCIATGIDNGNGAECVLVGLEDGGIYNLVAKNSFPSDFELSNSCSINRIVTSPDRLKFAVLDVQGKLYVFNGPRRSLIFSEKEVRVVAFNSAIDNLLCYYQNGLIIRSAHGIAHSSSFEGNIIAFRGNHVYYKSRNSLKRREIPMAPILRHHITHGDLNVATSIARSRPSCDMWSHLAGHVKMALDREFLPSSKDYHAMVYASRFEKRIRNQVDDHKSLARTETNFKAMTAIMKRQYESAASLFVQACNPILAVEMFLVLEKWARAREFAEETGCVDTSVITKRQAQWAVEKNDVTLAKSLYLECRAYAEAIKLVGNVKSDNWQKEILEILRNSPTDSNQSSIETAISVFEDAGANESHLAELYRIANDYHRLLQLHIRSQNYIAANQVFEQYKSHLDLEGVLSHAHGLIMQGHFQKAFEVYCEIGRYDLGQNIMNELSKSAAIMEEFRDASHSLWILRTALSESKHVSRCVMFVSRVTRRCK